MVNNGTIQIWIYERRDQHFSILQVENCTLELIGSGPKGFSLTDYGACTLVS